MTKAKVPMIIAAVVEVLGMIGFIAGVIADREPLLYLGTGLFIVGGIVLAITMWVDAHPSGSLPVKKLLICAGVLLAGAAITYALTVTVSGEGGWDNAGFEIILPTIPLIASVAVCAWFWQRND